MRIAVGSFVQESNHFSPIPGTWQHFGPDQIARGQAIFDQAADTRTEVAGIMDVAAKCGVELVPLLRAFSSSSTGPIKRNVYVEIRNELLMRLREAKAQNKADSIRLDGLILVLHGAMSAQGDDDATGDVLHAAREIVGPDVPIIGTLDLHANVTRGMVDYATALVGYHTFPHVDLYETGERAIELMISAIAKTSQPVTILRRIPMIVPAENAQTTTGPLSDVMVIAREAARMKGILDVSIFPVQPWLDLPDVACSVIVVADAPYQSDAEAYADCIAQAFWQRRDQFAVDLAQTHQAIEQALASDKHPFVFADSADAPSSGAPGDSTVVLEALLRAQPSKDCLTNIVDPDAVARMIDAGEGSEVTVRLGAKSSTTLYAPIDVTGQVWRIANGDFVHKGPGLRGVVMHRGQTAVLKVGHIFIVVMERAVIQWDPELYRSVGLEPADAHMVIVKSPAGFRAAYEPLAAEIKVLDAAGVCSPNLRALPFKRISRPLYPFDEMSSWR